MLVNTWVGFDLDDTLHEFRKASGAATLASLRLIETKHNIPIENLKASYDEILKMKTAQAFTDGKTSDEYGKVRFAVVLETFNIITTGAFLDELAATYKAVLGDSLEPKPGAVRLLVYLRSIGKRIVVITEGPQDAQESTIQKLGMEIDFLATTNAFGVSKVEGLFGKVLESLEIAAKDMVYVGDSEDRDVKPARKQGILTVHYDEKGGVVLDAEEMKIDALWKLEENLRGEKEYALV